MRQWAERKQQIKEYILRDLRQQGIKFPKDGHVFLEAVVKPNPHDRNTFDYELHRLEMSVDNEQDSQKEKFDNHIIYNSTSNAVSTGNVLLRGTIKLTGDGPPEEYLQKETIRIGPMPNADPDNL
ncbi:MAG: hypothetical protein U5L00_17965 [Desulfovermiculus sp.]|nr:hypothetical protein [Desulfovermiculus sp.]